MESLRISEGVYVLAFFLVFSPLFNEAFVGVINITQALLMVAMAFFALDVLYDKKITYWFVFFVFAFLIIFFMIMEYCYQGESKYLMMVIICSWFALRSRNIPIDRLLSITKCLLILLSVMVFCIAFDSSLYSNFKNGTRMSFSVNPISLAVYLYSLAIISFFILKGSVRYLSQAVFFVMAFFSASKGPMISFFIVLFGLMTKSFARFFLLVVAISLFANLWLFYDDQLRIFDFDSYYSIFSRIEIYKEAILIIIDNYIFGTADAHINGEMSPHNLLLALALYFGLIFVLLLLFLYFLLFFFGKSSIFMVLSLFFFLTSQFSFTLQILPAVVFFAILGSNCRRLKKVKV